MARQEVQAAGTRAPFHHLPKARRRLSRGERQRGGPQQCSQCEASPIVPWRLSNGCQNLGEAGEARTATTPVGAVRAGRDAARSIHRDSSAPPLSGAEAAGEVGGRQRSEEWRGWIAWDQPSWESVPERRRGTVSPAKPRSGRRYGNRRLPFGRGGLPHWAGAGRLARSRLWDGTRREDRINCGRPGVCTTKRDVTGLPCHPEGGKQSRFFAGRGTRRQAEKVNPLRRTSADMKTWRSSFDHSEAASSRTRIRWAQGAS